MFCCVSAGQPAEGDGEAAKYIRGAGWHTTLRTLHNELRNVAGGWQLAAIRLAGYVSPPFPPGDVNVTCCFLTF